MKNTELIKVQFENGMHGVYASRQCSVGTVVRALSLKEVSAVPTKTSIYIGFEKHVEDPIGIYINHACKPTCKIEEAFVISLVDLNVGDEITFNYNNSEISISSPFVCRCCGILIGSQHNS
mgnify:CR=1 FL=1